MQGPQDAKHPRITPEQNGFPMSQVDLINSRGSIENTLAIDLR